MSNSVSNQFVSKRGKLVHLKNVGDSNGIQSDMYKEEVVLISSTATCLSQRK